MSIKSLRARAAALRSLSPQARSASPDDSSSPMGIVSRQDISAPGLTQLGGPETKTEGSAPTLVTNEIRALATQPIRRDGKSVGTAAQELAKVIWLRALEGDRHCIRHILDRLDGPVISRTELLALEQVRIDPGQRWSEALERIYGAESTPAPAQIQAFSPAQIQAFSLGGTNQSNSTVPPLVEGANSNSQPAPKLEGPQAKNKEENNNR